MNFVFTVCDNAANEACPVWPGVPATAHWGLEDPAAAKGTETERRSAFAEAYLLLKKRIEAFTALPFESFGTEELRKKLEEIGRPGSEEAG